MFNLFMLGLDSKVVKTGIISASAASFSSLAGNFWNKSSKRDFVKNKTLEDI